MLVLIKGEHGAGKTTLATLAAKQLHGEVMSYADPIKDTLCAMLGVNREQLEQMKRANATVTLHKRQMTTREAHIVLGEMMRVKWPTLFGEHLAHRIRVPLSQGRPVFVDDYREEHELGPVLSVASSHYTKTTVVHIDGPSHVAQGYISLKRLDDANKMLTVLVALLRY